MAVFSSASRMTLRVRLSQTARHAANRTLSCTTAHPNGGVDGHINRTVKKDEQIVVDTFNADELGRKKAFCRCWKSSKFPLCDGAHKKHNEETGDNVGPLIVNGPS